MSIQDAPEVPVCTNHDESSDFKFVLEGNGRAVTTFSDGRTFHAFASQFLDDGRPCGWGTMRCKDQEHTGDYDSSGRSLDGKRFVKNGKPGFLKFYAMRGINRNRYELLFLNQCSSDVEFVDPDEAFKLSIEGERYESEQKERNRARMPC